MKYFLFYLSIFISTQVHSQCSEFDNLLKKGDNYLKSSKPNYQEAINAYTAAILACSDRAGEAKQRITRMVNDISKLKENAVAAEKKAGESLKKLQKATEDFVQRFLQNARKDVSDGRFEDAMEKIKTAEGLGVLKEEVCNAYMENADSGLLHNQFELALEFVKSAAAFGILPTEEIGRVFLSIAEKSILYLRYEPALESTKNAAALGVLKPELSRIYLEIAFWYGETGNVRRAGSILDSAAQLVNKKIDAGQPPRKAIEAFDLRTYKKLMERYYPVLVQVEGGIFDMGCDPGEQCIYLHKQEVSSFQMAKYETTWWQYNLFCMAMGNKHERPVWGTAGDYPAVKVNWFDAVEYCNWVSKQLSKTECIIKKEEKNMQ